MRKYCLTLIIALLFVSGFAYETGKSPGKAALYSFFIPGGGQYYNEAPWKALFWGGTEVGFIALTAYHQKEFNNCKDHRSKATNEADWTKWNKKAGDELRNRNNGFWWLGGTIILSVMDAYVDAALFNYEEEERKLNLDFSYNYLGLEFRF